MVRTINLIFVLSLDSSAANGVATATSVPSVKTVRMRLKMVPMKRYEQIIELYSAVPRGFTSRPSSSRARTVGVGLIACALRFGITGRFRTQIIADFSPGFWMILRDPLALIQSTSIVERGPNPCCCAPREAWWNADEFTAAPVPPV